MATKGTEATEKSLTQQVAREIIVRGVQGDRIALSMNIDYAIGELQSLGDEEALYEARDVIGYNRQRSRIGQQPS